MAQSTIETIEIDNSTIDNVVGSNNPNYNSNSNSGECFAFEDNYLENTTLTEIPNKEKETTSYTSVSSDYQTIKNFFANQIHNEFDVGFLVFTGVIVVYYIIRSTSSILAKGAKKFYSGISSLFSSKNKEYVNPAESAPVDNPTGSNKTLRYSKWDTPSTSSYKKLLGRTEKIENPDNF